MNVTETFKYVVRIEKHLTNLFGHDDNFEVHICDPGTYEKDSGRKTIINLAIYKNDNGKLKAWYIFGRSAYIKTKTVAGLQLRRTALSSLVLIDYSHPSGYTPLSYRHINDASDIDAFFEDVEKEVLS
jgi:hypothetical protein